MWQIVCLLHGRSLLPCTEQCIESGKCRFSPDDKTANMTTRCQFQQVELINCQSIDTRNVTEGLADTLQKQMCTPISLDSVLMQMMCRYKLNESLTYFILVVNNQWTTTLNATTITHFTATSTKTLRLVHLRMQ